MHAVTNLFRNFSTRPDIKLALALAQTGKWSRRQAERLIDAGRVHVDDRLEINVARRVDPTQSSLQVDGKEVVFPSLAQQKAHSLVAWYKPPVYVISENKEAMPLHDSQGRIIPHSYVPTHLDALAAHHLPRLLAIGRLDCMSEGLLLLTSNSRLKQYIEHPSSHIRRTYVVTCSDLEEATSLQQLESRLDRLRAGIVVNTFQYLPMTIELLRFDQSSLTGSTHRWEYYTRLPLLQRSSRGIFSCTVEMTEGKNREIRQAFQAIGCRVMRLVRTQIGTVSVDKLKLRSGQMQVLSLREMDASWHEALIVSR